MSAFSPSSQVSRRMSSNSWPFSQCRNGLNHFFVIQNYCLIPARHCDSAAASKLKDSCWRLGDIIMLNLRLK